MIIDKLSNIEKHFTNKKLAEKIKEFLMHAEEKEVGTHDIFDGTFAKVQAYETKPLTEVKMEAHVKYLDLQYIHKGAETVISVDKGENAPITEYNEVKDVVFYSPKEYSSDDLLEGSFAIMFPNDLHQCIAKGSPVALKKVVVKIPVDAI